MKKTLRNDIILIVALLLLALGTFILINQITKDKKAGDLTAHIYSGDDLIQEINLSNVTKEEEIVINGAISDVVIVVNHNSIKIKESGCPEHICINTGEVTEAGKSITCLPNKIHITVTGTGADA